MHKSQKLLALSTDLQRHRQATASVTAAVAKGYAGNAAA
jgi:hypothetical protein